MLGLEGILGSGPVPRPHPQCLWQLVVELLPTHLQGLLNPLSQRQSWFLRHPCFFVVLSHVMFKSPSCWHPAGPSLCSAIAHPALFLIRQALEAQGGGLFSLVGTSPNFHAVLWDFIPRPMGTVLVLPTAPLEHRVPASGPFVLEDTSAPTRQRTGEVEPTAWRCAPFWAPELPTVVFISWLTKKPSKWPQISRAGCSLLELLAS